VSTASNNDCNSSRFKICGTVTASDGVKRYPLITVIDSFTFPLEGPFHGNITGYQRINISIVQAEAVKSFQDVSFIIVDKAVSFFLSDKSLNIRSEGAFIMIADLVHDSRPPFTSIPSSEMAHCRIDFPSVERYVMTVELSLCPNVSAIIVGFVLLISIRDAKVFRVT